MQTSHKGSKVYVYRCKPDDFDLAYAGSAQTLTRLMQGYPLPYKIAANCNYFAGATPLGWIVERGNVWNAPDGIDEFWPVFMAGHVELSAGPCLVSNGKRDDTNIKALSRFFSGFTADTVTNQTAIGQDADHNVVLVVTASMNLWDLADVMLQQGMTYGIKLDGGGSTGLLVEGGLEFGSASRRIPNAIVMREIIEEEVKLFVDFRQDFIPVGRANRPGKRMRPTHITVHDTGNPSKGADALAHAKYLKSDASVKVQASWHYTVDDKRIVQHIPWTETAWHTGTAKGNACSIGIEICENAGGDRAQAEGNAVRLIADLLREIGLTPDAVVPHLYWSGKHCPHIILGRMDGWANFMMKVRGAYHG